MFFIFYTNVNNEEISKGWSNASGKVVEIRRPELVY